jgi:adenylate kinase family enzyme
MANPVVLGDRDLTDARSRALVVELVGPAGAGKTTLAEALARLDPSIHVDVSLSRLRTIPVYVVDLVRLLPDLVRYRRAVPRFARRDARAMVYLSGWRRELTKIGQGVRDATVLDHGPIFRLAYLSEFGPALVRGTAFRRWWRREATAWGGILDLVVLLDAPDEQLVERIRSRERSHAVKDRPRDEASRYLNRYRTAFEHVLTVVRRAGDVEVLRFDTSECAPETIASEVIERLRERLPRG